MNEWMIFTCRLEMCALPNGVLQSLDFRVILIVFYWSYWIYGPEQAIEIRQSAIYFDNTSLRRNARPVMRCLLANALICVSSSYYCRWFSVARRCVSWLMHNDTYVNFNRNEILLEYRYVKKVQRLSFIYFTDQVTVL